MMRAGRLGAAMAAWACLAAIAIGGARAQQAPANNDHAVLNGPFGQPTSSLQADFTMNSGGNRMEGLLAHIANRQRWELRFPKATLIVVLYLDVQASYTILPSVKKYLEVDQSTVRRDDIAWTADRQQSEVRDGVTTTRYLVEGKRPDGHAFKGEMWLAEPYNLVVEAHGTSTVRGVAHQFDYKITAIRVGAQDPALFYPPPDYERLGTGLGVAPVKP